MHRSSLLNEEISTFEYTEGYYTSFDCWRKKADKICERLGQITGDGESRQKEEDTVEELELFFSTQGADGLYLRQHDAHRNWIYANIGLMYRLAQANCNFMSLRGNSARSMDLADIHSLALKDEGIKHLDNGKTNRFGRIEYGSCLRNIQVMLCFCTIAFTWVANHFRISGRIRSGSIQNYWKQLVCANVVCVPSYCLCPIY